MNEKIRLLYFGMSVLITCVIYFFCVTFIPIPVSGQKYSDIILGALIGSGFTAIIQFYWGSSKSSQDKDERKV